MTEMPLPIRNSSEKAQISSVKIYEQKDKAEREDMLDQIASLEFKMNKKKTPGDEESPGV